MTFTFIASNKTEFKELGTMVDIVNNEHFDEKDILKCYSVSASNIVVVELKNEAYFEDIEKAKKNMYEFYDTERVMEDYISDLEEHLSFKCHCLVQ